MRIGVDFGTSNISFCTQSGKRIITEPCIVACDAYTGAPASMGRKAVAMTGRTPDSIKIVRPVRDGVVSDYEVTVKMLRYYIGKMCSASILKPDVMVSVPSSMTELEKMTVLDAFDDAGAGRICLIEESMAAALGSGVEMNEPKGIMFADIGGGCVDTAVITMGDIAFSRTLKTGSEYLTADIVKYLRRERDIETGELTAEDIKRKIGGAVKRSETVALVTAGKNAVSGAPVSFEVTSTEVYYAMSDRVDMIVSGIINVLSKTTPELSADIFDTGIVLTGNGAKLFGLAEHITECTGVKTRIAPDPGRCVINGLKKSLGDLGYLRKNGYIFKSGESVQG